MATSLPTSAVWRKVLTVFLVAVLCATGLTLMSPKAHAAGYKPKDTL